MNFQDIQIPFLLGGADDDESPKKDPTKINPAEATPETNAIAMQDIEAKISGTSFFSKHSSLFFIMIASAVVMYIMYQSNKKDMNEIINNPIMAIGFFGALSVIGTCAVLIFTGYGSDKAIKENIKDA